MSTSPLPIAVQEEIKRLEPLSPYVPEILDLAQQEDVSLLAVGRVVSFDPVLSAHLIQACQIAAYGINRRVESPLQAAALLGLQRVIQIVLSVALKRQVRLHHDEFESWLWEHLLNVAFGVQTMLRKFLLVINASEAFSAGLFHDFGKLLLYRAAPKSKRKALFEAQKKGGEEGLAAERELVGCTHVEVIAHVLKKWNLSESIKRAICEHHQDPGGEKKPDLGQWIRRSHLMLNWREGEPIPSALPFSEKMILKLQEEVRREVEAVSYFF